MSHYIKKEITIPEHYHEVKEALAFARGWSPLTVKSTQNAPTVVLRDNLVHSCRLALQNLERGVSFETVTTPQLDNLTQLADQALMLRAAIVRYQQNRG